MDYCYGKIPLNFAVNPAQNGQMAAVLNFRYNTLRITYFHRYSLGGTSVDRLGRSMNSTERLSFSYVIHIIYRFAKLLLV